MAKNTLKFLYAGIEVRDLDRSLRFYRALGFRIASRGKMEHGGAWVHLRLPHQHQRLELNYYPPGNPYRRPYRRGSELDHLGFFAVRLDPWVKRAVRAGGKVVSRFDETNFSLVYVADPDGIWVEFFSRRRRTRKT